jgi:hypothetical protein
MGDENGEDLQQPEKQFQFVVTELILKSFTQVEHPKTGTNMNATAPPHQSKWNLL